MNKKIAGALSLLVVPLLQGQMLQGQMLPAQELLVSRDVRQESLLSHDVRQPALNLGPDLILKNGKVLAQGRRVAPLLRWDEAVSVKDGIILGIGTTKEIEKTKTAQTKVIDLKGKLVLPAFNDAHNHFLSGGLSLSRLQLDGVKSPDEFKSRIKTYAVKNQRLHWIFGSGWDHTAWPKKAGEKKYPSRQDIDAVVKDRPVLLWHVDGHTIVVNTKALELLGTGRKDEHTGIIMEDEAQEASRKVDNPSLEEIRQATLDAQAECLKFGVVSVQGSVHARHMDKFLQVVKELHDARKLRIRFSLWGSIDEIDSFIAFKEKWSKLFPPEWVNFYLVKGFVDGVLSGHTAALFEPYTDKPSELGTPEYIQETLNALVLKANKAGFPVALHAIGDRAIAMALNAFAASSRQLFNSKLRNRIEHVEISSEHLYKQFKDLGVVASMQPSHIVYDKESENYNETRVGAKRSKHAFALNNFQKAGVTLAFGTDWPVMPVNPMIGLFAAHTRQNYNRKPVRGWIPEQKISLMDAIAAYTQGSAFAQHEEHIKGSIHEGKVADLVVMRAGWEKNGAALDPKKNETVFVVVGGILQENVAQD